MMSRGRAIFTEADVTRALKAAQKAGLPVYKYEIDLDGKDCRRDREGGFSR